MRLSEYFPAEMVLRDADFDALGLSNSRVQGRMLSFLEDPRYAGELNANPNIYAVICQANAVPSLAEHIQGVVICEAPRKAYFTLHNHLAETAAYRLPVKETTIGSGCRISPLAYIAPEGVEIGDNVVIEEFVTVKGPCRIGDHTILHAGAKIGGEGFEFKRFAESVLDVSHCGAVEIGSHVIIWENTTVHKAVYPWDMTKIGDYSRIGANSHIDHGAKLAAFSEVCAGAILSGRTELGDHAFIGPGTVVSNRISVGSGAKALIGSVVTKDVPDGQTVSGNFAIEHKKHLESVKKLC